MTAMAAQPRQCSVARTLEIVGEKWALLAVREVFLGNRRFDEMIRRTGAPRDTLAARLRSLTGAGCSRPFTVSMKVTFRVAVCRHGEPRRAGCRAGFRWPGCRGGGQSVAV